MVKKREVRELALWLREIRAERGLTQAEVAEILQINQGTYSRYERGAGEPDRDRGLFDRLQNLLGLDNDAFNAVMVETAFAVSERRL
jgi:transcriptional regulator with XRE-family HTH domain